MPLKLTTTDLRLGRDVGDGLPPNWYNDVNITYG